MARADAERQELIEQLEDFLEIPMLVLGVAWLVLLVLELVSGLPRVLEAFGTGIWIVFLLEFALRFALAPRKGTFLTRNVVTLIALAIPAFRVFRAARALRLIRIARVARGMRFVRVLTSVNRGVRSLRVTLGRNGFGYVVATTTLVTLAGAAGMLAFERDEGGIRDYGTALWWTAMMMTTMGSEYWPKSAEGRLLCVLLALYAFAVFGYVTATLASFLIGRDAARPGGTDLEALRREITTLREELRRMRPSRPAPTTGADRQP